MTPVEHALSLAVEGIPVFPLHGKVPPKGMHFKERASCDPDAIRAMFAGYPRADGVGIYTGHGLLIVDVDVKPARGKKPAKDGRRGVMALDLEGCDLPDTRRHQREGSDGYHLIYKTTAPCRNTSDTLAVGVDTRAFGGYVKAYPSDGVPIAEAPAWLIERTKRGRAKDSADPAGGGADDVLSRRIDRDRAEQRAIEYLLRDAPVAVEGQAGDTGTFKVAARLKDFGVGESRCFDLLAEHWNPKCVPTWSDDDLRNKVRNAYAYGFETPGAASPEADFPPVAAEQPKQTGRLRIKKFSQFDKPKKKVWLAEDLFDQYGVAMAYGASGAKKSYFALHACMAIARGVPLFGRKTMKGATLYVAGEGDKALERRAIAMRQVNNIDVNAPFALVTSSVGIKFYGEKTDIGELIEKAKAFEKEAGEKLLFLPVDTLAAVTAGANENAGEDMGSFMQKMQILSQQLQCCVLIIHHSGKDEARGGRGWSGLKGALETELHIYDDKIDVTKQRDGKDGYTFGSFSLQTVLLDCEGGGTDEAAVLIEGAVVARAPSSLGGQDKLAYETLVAEMKVAGEVVDGIGAPAGTRTLTGEAWRAAFARSHGSTSRGTIDMAFNRAFDRLARDRIVGVIGDGSRTRKLVWLQRAPASEDFASPRDEALPA